MITNENKTQYNDIPYDIKEEFYTMKQSFLDIKKTLDSLNSTNQKLLENNKQILGKLENQLDEKTRKIANIENALEDSKRKIETVNNEKNKLLERCSALESQLDEKNKKIANIENALEDLKRRTDAVNNEKNKLLERCSVLESQLDEKNRKIASIENALEDSKRKIETVNNEKMLIAAEQIKIADAMDKMTAKYAPISELENIYNIYNALPQNLKNSMAGFINGDTLLSFVTSGSRDSKIDMFWEFCRTEVERSTGLEYAQNFSAIFTFFFTHIMSATDSPLYTLNAPSIGTEFDEDTMTFSNNSKSRSGEIDSVVLPGFTGINTGKIIKKAIVTLKAK